MTWRPLYSDPPPLGTLIVIREGTTDKDGRKIYHRLEACGEWVGHAAGGLLNECEDPIRLPPVPDYVVVEPNGRPAKPVRRPRSAMSHLKEVREWFACRTQELDGKAYELKPDGAVRLWEFMEENGVTLKGIELAVYRSSTSITEIRRRKRQEKWVKEWMSDPGGGKYRTWIKTSERGQEWTKVQMDREGKYRTWIARVRPE